MRRRIYAGILCFALVAGLASSLLHGFAPFSKLSYFTEMYPFFWGVAILDGIFLFILRLPQKSLAGVVLYWVAIAGTVIGCFVLCALGLFVNPLNWKNYTDYTVFDQVWAPASNILLVLASIALVVLMLRELRAVRRSSIMPSVK